MVSLHPLKRKKDAYRAVFKTEPGKVVLTDLRALCCATRTTHVNGDIFGTMMNEGARTVFNRIMTMLETDYEEIFTYNEEDYYDD